MRQAVSRELELVLLLWHSGRDGDLDEDDLWLRGLRHLKGRVWSIELAEWAVAGAVILGLRNRAGALWGAFFVNFSFSSFRGDGDLRFPPSESEGVVVYGMAKELEKFEIL